MVASTARWPELPYAAWKDTRDTLHLWTQVVGKVRLALTPWLNHSWHVTLYVTARGLTTSPIPDGGARFQIDFDFIDHVLWMRTSDGHFRQLMLKPMSRWRSSMPELMIGAARARHRRARSTTMPNEIADRRAVQRGHARTRPTTPTTRNRFWRVLLVGARGVRAFPHRLSRQGEPGAFLLGQLRSGGDALFRARARRRIRAACRTCRTRWRARPIRTRCRAPASGRAAAGRSTMPAFYSYAYPAPEGFAAAR